MSRRHIGYVVLIILVVFLGWFSLPGSAGVEEVTPPLEETVPINGIAYWGTAPTGADFQGVRRIPFQARNPIQAVWDQTQDQIQSFIDSDYYIENIQVSHSGWFTYASHYLNDFSEVMVYLDPTDQDHLLGASKFFYYPQGYDFYTGVFESYDGGLTWTQFQPGGVEDYSMTSDPVTTFDDVGNGYFTLLTRGPTGLDMLKKPVGGQWELPVVVDRTTNTDKQWIMGDQNPQGASPYSGNLYMSWTAFGPLYGIVFSRSTDSNQSWSAPILLTGGDVQGSIPGVAPDGTVYVVFGRNIFYGPAPGTMEFVKSTDGGVTFNSASIAANITAIPFNLPNPFGGVNFRTPASLPAFAISPINGNLYIAWADYRDGDADIYFTRSTDGGDTWASPVRLNDDPIGNGIDQFQPQVSVSPGGRVAVMWFDRRLPCPNLAWVPPNHVGLQNACIDTFMTRSYDDGQTWTPNARASAQTWDWTLNLPITGGGDGFIGDYQGIASSDEYDFPFWNATANLGENVENYQEVFVARIPVPYYNLSVSEKTAYPEQVAPGEMLTYTISLNNVGLDDAPAVTLTDTLPLSTTYVPDSLTYPAGMGGYDPVGEVITWTGALSVNVALEIAFQVHVDSSLPQGALIVNSATIRDGSGIDYQRVATATVNAYPQILSTKPYAGENNVPVDDSIEVTFSEPMDINSLEYTISPDPYGWDVVWNVDQTVVTLTHASFDYSQSYAVSVTAEDQSGLILEDGPVPNPWSFTTEMGPAPFILLTKPADGESGVPITASLEITFSEPIVTGTLEYTITPDPGGWQATWNADNTMVMLSHSRFNSLDTYTVTVTAEDMDGLPLDSGPVPNPWTYTTQLGPPPYIKYTYPEDGELGVPTNASLVVSFSEPVLTNTLVYTITPNPGELQISWNGIGTVVTMTSTSLLDFGQAYTVTVTVQDVDGLRLEPGPVPSRWHFMTVLMRIFLPVIQR